MPTPERPDRAGWYDDPDNSEQLRYFDGIVWTANVTPRRTRWETPPVAHPSAPESTHPYAGPSVGSESAGHQGPPPTSWPTAPHVGGAVALGPAVDGVPLASYGARVLAYLIDALIVGVLATIAGGWFLWKALEPVWATLNSSIQSGDPQVAMKAYQDALNGMDAKWLAAFAAVQLVVQLAYQLFFLTRWSATPGKLALGISVRRLDRAGVLDFNTATRRAGFVTVLGALGSVPVISLLASMATIADLLWPLGDKKRQALHDKVAQTVVVRGPQARPVSAPGAPSR